MLMLSFKSSLESSMRTQQMLIVKQKQDTCSSNCSRCPLHVASYTPRVSPRHNVKVPSVFKNWPTNFFLGVSLATASIASFLAGTVTKNYLLWNQYVDSRVPPSQFACNSAYENPTRQYIWLAIDRVDISFDRCIEIMEHELWREQLLSYHCQYVNKNAHCYGLLKGGGHLMLDRWSNYKEVDLEYFTGCGVGRGRTSDISELVLSMEGLIVGDDPEFLIGKSNLTRTEWAHVTRVEEFADVDKSSWDKDPLHGDLGRAFLSVEMFKKNQVASIKSDYQQIDVFDVLEPSVTPWDSYNKSLSGDGSYESRHSELYEPNRIVFLDGVMQSSSRGDEAYHESLVHPGMLAHPSPVRVAIIGGGEGATLREILKHDTVQLVKMIEIDEAMVEYSRLFLPKWNSCDDVTGSTACCFDDERVDVQYMDAADWFVDRYMDGQDSGSQSDGHFNNPCDNGEDGRDCYDEDDSDDVLVVSDDAFDVIIMDALDPNDNVAFAETLYNNYDFLTALYNGLTNDGVLIIQLGAASWVDDPPEEYTDGKSRARLTRALSWVGFQVLHEYEESHCGFGDPWKFSIACKSKKCSSKWYTNAALKDAEIHQRIRATKSGTPSLKYIDGPTLALYQAPHRSSETISCRSPFALKDCYVARGFRPEARFFTEKSFAVMLDEGGKAGLFSRVHIPKMSYLKVGTALNCEPKNLEQANNVSDSSIKSMRTGMLAGFFNMGMFLWMKTGSKEVANVATLASFLTPKDNSNAENVEMERNVLYNLVLDRHRSTYAGSVLLSLRAISVGEELIIEELS